MEKLELRVIPTTADAGGGFAVQVFVDGNEMTQRGAGLGMDPYDILVPVNRLLPGAAPSRVPIARCSCGVYGCGETDVEISVSGDVVRWSWLKEQPGISNSEFLREAYLAEVQRVGADISWETPGRTAGRLILARIGERLPDGLKTDWVGNYWRGDNAFRVCLRFEQTHQVFVDFLWNERSPEELASEVIRELTTRPPREWSASWHSFALGGTAPAIAGQSWSKAQVP